jgi:hypothetical protein
MANGVGTSRPARGIRRGRRASRPTIREVCLVGMDHRAGDAGWTMGQEVTWQGRGYRVIAAVPAEDSPVEQPQRYVHLAPMLGD